MRRGFDAVAQREEAASKELRAIHEQAATMAGLMASGADEGGAAPSTVSPPQWAPDGERSRAAPESEASAAAPALLADALTAPACETLAGDAPSGVSGGLSVGASDGASGGASVAGSTNAVWGLMAEHSRLRYSALMETGVDALAKALNEQDTVAEEQTRTEVCSSRPVLISSACCPCTAPPLLLHLSPQSLHFLTVTYLSNPSFGSSQLDALRTRRQIAMRISRERLAQAGVGHAAARGRAAAAVHISRRGSVTINGDDLYAETKVVDAFDV